jgi:DNA-binding NarL/FixJ family response regulator
LPVSVSLIERAVMTDTHCLGPVPLHGPKANDSQTVTVAVQAADPILGAGAVAYLRSRPDIQPVPATCAHFADVTFILADTLSDELVAWMQQVANQTADGEGRFVIVADGLAPAQLLRAFCCGPLSVIPRRECDYEQVVQAIRLMRQGFVKLPGTELRSLIMWRQWRPLRAALLPPPGRTSDSLVAAAAPATSAGRLDQREREVLRMVADGFGTAEIAKRLNYSERTVKNILHRLLTRMNLRNRAHAVAYAVGNGLL